jgi:uncharacterized membrane protein
MEPTLGVVSLWLVFGGTHIGLATVPVRGALVRRLGELGYRVLFSLIAAASFTLLVSYYALHRFEGAPGLALGSVPWLRWPLMGVVVAGIALLVASTTAYPDSPYDIFAGEQVHAPRGLERVTRHPFFVGVTLLALAHTLLATRLVGTVFAAMLAFVALAGAWHQDRKLLATRRGYADYLAATSLLPFGAVLAGRQHIVWGELPLGTTAVGVAIAFALRSVHDSIFAHGGAYVFGSVVAAAAIITLQSWLRSRRRTNARHHPDAAADLRLHARP